MYHHWDLGWPPTEKLAMFFLFCCYWSCNYLQRCSYFFQWIFCISNVQYRYTIQNTDILTISVLRIIGPTQVNRRLLISRILMKWISSIFWKCWQLFCSISKKCRKFIASKMLEIKSRHLTWGEPYITYSGYIVVEMQFLLKLLRRILKYIFYEDSRTKPHLVSKMFFIFQYILILT